MNEIDWSKLSFGYMKADYNVRCTFKDGKWGELRVCDSEMVEMHMAATVLHYGQAGFEGLKAFRGKDGKIRIFRMDENGKRLISTSKGIMMAELPLEKFEEAVLKVVKLNEHLVPPYESGATLYIRPVLFGTGPQVGVKPANEFEFIIFVMPVGPYFKEGFMTTPVCVLRHYDRAAPYGTGRYKVGGNYAASLCAGEEAHAKGYSAVLYLDARQKKYIDECGPANFFAIKGNKYITPQSESILPSITNKSLMTLADDMGMEVEQRPVLEDELNTFDEAGMCGTAAVISPISRIDDLDENKTYTFSKDGKPGEVCTKLYKRLRAIQYGDEADKFNWITVVE
ncbi:MAG: branched-chain amino acid aminotransferase [Bacteroidales bacterium]|nr:branched-chain amino acid aminotransferase [Bacteroidales bacterium]